MKLNNDIKIEDSVLYNINSLEKLMLILGISSKDEFVELSKNTNYKVYRIEAKNRLVEEPLEKLKKVQTKFNKLLQQIITPEYVFAGRKKMNYIKNALAHIDCNDMVCTDIKKFFPNTNRIYTLSFLTEHLKMSKDIAEILTNILTIDGHLPTGAPSSPLLTFWSYRTVFDKIYFFAKNLGITMTIYIDDMTFSSKSKVSSSLIPFVREELIKVGLKLHPDKIKRFKCSKNKHVTGNCINRKHQLIVPNKQREKFINLIKNKELNSLTTEQLASGIGQIKTMQLIEPKIFEPTLKKLLNIYKQRPKPIAKKRNK